MGEGRCLRCHSLIWFLRTGGRAGAVVKGELCRLWVLVLGRGKGGKGGGERERGDELRGEAGGDD